MVEVVRVEQRGLDERPLLEPGLSLVDDADLALFSSGCGVNSSVTTTIGGNKGSSTCERGACIEALLRANNAKGGDEKRRLEDGVLRLNDELQSELGPRER